MGSCQSLLHPLQSTSSAMDNSEWLGSSTGRKQGNFKWLFPQYTRSFSTALCWILTACFRGSLKGASGARMNEKIGRALGAIAGGRRWSQEKDNHPMSLQSPLQKTGSPSAEPSVCEGTNGGLRICWHWSSPH